MISGRRTPSISLAFFFFNDTATTEIYTLSLHDALPILFELCSAPAASVKNGADDQSARTAARNAIWGRWNRVCSMLLKMPSRAVEKYHIGPSVTERRICGVPVSRPSVTLDRKSTRLNSSHSQISYAVFCLK